MSEKRRFVVPAELCFKRRVFGQTPPKDDDVLIDVELLALQPASGELQLLLPGIKVFLDVRTRMFIAPRTGRQRL